MSPLKGVDAAAADPGGDGSLAIDPVCEQVVDADAVEHSSVHLGKPYFFCCGNCKAAFDREPARYVEAKHRGPYL